MTNKFVQVFDVARVRTPKQQEKYLERNTRKLPAPIARELPRQPSQPQPPPPTDNSQLFSLDKKLRLVVHKAETIFTREHLVKIIAEMDKRARK